LLAAVDGWAKSMGGGRSEAIRRLIERGLAAGEPPTPKRRRAK
jgi:hypothetical protein